MCFPFLDPNLLLASRYVVLTGEGSWYRRTRVGAKEVLAIVAGLSGGNMTDSLSLKTPLYS